jgi:hypothetical protein
MRRSQKSVSSKATKDCLTDSAGCPSRRGVQKATAEEVLSLYGGRRVGHSSTQGKLLTAAYQNASQGHEKDAAPVTAG